MTVPRVAFLMLVITLLGVAAVVRLPGPGARSRSGRTHAVHWLAFSADGGAFLPPRGWSAVDPFTSHTPHRGLVWLQDMPRQGARLALIRAPAGQDIEVFLMFDRGEELARLAESGRAIFDDGAPAPRAASGSARTADGADLAYEVVRTSRGPLPGKDLTLFLGLAEHAGGSLVVTAGGPTEDFALAPILEIVRSLRVPR